MTTVINDDALELGPCNLYVGEKPRASLTTALTGNRDLTFRARKTGAAGNGITIEYKTAGSGSAESVQVTTTAIAITLRIGGSTADQIKDAVNNDFAAFSLVYAVRAAGSDGSGLVVADLGPTALSGGSDTVTDVFLGGLGEETALNVSTEAAGLTAHLTGTLNRDKVITGGSMQLIAPLKEITLDNFARAFGNAILIEGGGGLRRLDFVARVGESLRQSRGARLTLKKVIGGVESTDPEDVLVIPEASPVDAEVSLAFNVTDQRVLSATFEAWPDANGRLAYWGTAIL